MRSVTHGQAVQAANQVQLAGATTAAGGRQLAKVVSIGA